MPHQILPHVARYYHMWPDNYHAHVTRYCHLPGVAIMQLEVVTQHVGEAEPAAAGNLACADCSDNSGAAAAAAAAGRFPALLLGFKLVARIRLFDGLAL